jgi:hypothetical protein
MGRGRRQKKKGGMHGQALHYTASRYVAGKGCLGQTVPARVRVIAAAPKAGFLPKAGLPKAGLPAAGRPNAGLPKAGLPVGLAKAGLA